MFYKKNYFFVANNKMTKETTPNIKSIFSIKRILIPIAIGIGFSAYSFYSTNFDLSVLTGINISLKYMMLAIFCMFIRDFMYMIRIRVLTDNQLSWRDSWHVVMLWEFASSVTPSMVGGSAFAIYFLNQEGISAGKSTAIALTTAMLDELFYIIAVGLLLIFWGTDISNMIASLKFELFGYVIQPLPFFFIGYVVIISLTTIILLGVFVAPKGIKKLLVALFSISFLKKWQHILVHFGDDLITASIELKNKKFGYWAKAFTATIFTWTARFMVLNFLILAFNPELGFHFVQQLGIFAKQLVMWVILLISPTPGASGVAEICFTEFFKDFFLENTNAAVAVLWRTISYYPYLALGLIILPIWLRKIQRVKGRKGEKRKETAINL